MKVTVNDEPALVENNQVVWKRAIGEFRYDISKNSGMWSPDGQRWLIDGKEIKFYENYPK